MSVFRTCPGHPGHFHQPPRERPIMSLIGQKFACILGSLRRCNTKEAGQGEGGFAERPA
jgi:hypothetical protein